jgi:hypothetical protein
LLDQVGNLLHILQAADPHQGQFRQNAAVAAVPKSGKRLIQDLHDRQDIFHA